MSIINRKSSGRLNKTISNMTVDRIKAEASNTKSSDIGELVNLPIEKIVPDPTQPRKTLENIESLAKTIDENDLLQPISVREVDTGYMIIAGERRYQAFKFLKRKTMPCIIKNYDNKNDILVLQLLENDQREQMKPFEVSEAINRLSNKNNMGVTDIAKKLGVSKDWVSIRKQLKYIDPKIKELSELLDIRDVRSLIDINRLNEKDVLLADRVIKNIKNGKVDGSYRSYIKKSIEKYNSSKLNQDGVASKNKTIQEIEYLDEQDDRVIIKITGSKKPLVLLKSNNFNKQ